MHDQFDPYLEMLVNLHVGWQGLKIDTLISTIIISTIHYPFFKMNNFLSFATHYFGIEANTTTDVTAVEGMMRE